MECVLCDVEYQTMSIEIQRKAKDQGRFYYLDTFRSRATASERAYADSRRASSSAMSFDGFFTLSEYGYTGPTAWMKCFTFLCLKLGVALERRKSKPCVEENKRMNDRK